jgi:hypothetical protein
MAGKYGPADVTVALEDAPGGTTRAIQNFILNGISAKDIARMMQSDCLGDAWEEHVPTGKKAAAPITLEGLWDTTATTGTHAVLGSVDDGPEDDGRELIVVFGDSKTWTVDCRLAEYEVIASNDSVQRFSCLLQPTGAAVWS